MTATIARLMVLCAASVLVAGCLSVNVDKTETNTTTSADDRPVAGAAGAAD